MADVSLKKEMGRFLGLFLILYCIVFIVLNITGWLIRPRPLEVPSGVNEPQETEPQEQGEPEKEEPACIFSEKPDSILIPKIGIEAPLVFLESADEDFKKALDQGVVHYPESELPGQEGTAILLGHSAPMGWPKIKYDWVFSDLKKLEEEDEILVFFKNCQYLYRVSKQLFLERGAELPHDLTNSKNMLVLISCWPPGKNIQRIAIQATLDTTLDKSN